VDIAAKEMEQAGLAAKLMIDFSHANSSKQPLRQIEVANEVAR
jgi:3-deoxy-7-phosphoheptulonate synthase